MLCALAGTQPRLPLPVVAVPATAGTGPETSAFAVETGTGSRRADIRSNLLAC